MQSSSGESKRHDFRFCTQMGSLLEDEPQQVQDMMRALSNKEHHVQEAPFGTEGKEKEPHRLLLCSTFSELVHVLRYLAEQRAKWTLVQIQGVCFYKWKHGKWYYYMTAIEKELFLETYSSSREQKVQRAFACLCPEVCIVLGTAVSSWAHGGRLGQLVVGNKLITLHSKYEKSNDRTLFNFASEFRSHDLLHDPLSYKDTHAWSSETNKAFQQLADQGWSAFEQRTLSRGVVYTQQMLQLVDANAKWQDGWNRNDFRAYFDIKEVIQGNILEETEDIEGPRVETYVNCVETHCMLRKERVVAQYLPKSQKVLHLCVVTSLFDAPMAKLVLSEPLVCVFFFLLFSIFSLMLF